MDLRVIGARAKEAASYLNSLGITEKNEGLRQAAQALLDGEEDILTANQEDVIRAAENGMSQGMIDRLELTPDRLQAMANGLLRVAELPDPVGEVTSMKPRPNGLLIGEKRVPLGVVGMIYEARPNVTVDAAVLCLKSGNAVILRGSKDILRSNICLVKLMRQALTEAGLDPARVEQLHAPTGLAIGAKTAEEIALSILAQIVQVKSTRSLTEGFPPAILEAFRALQTPAVLATIVSRHGSTPREVGSKMLVLPEGRAVGSVGGGIMEYRIQQLAGKMLAGAVAPAQLADLTTDGTGDDAAIAACGGSMQVFLQRIEPEE